MAKTGKAHRKRPPTGGPPGARVKAYKLNAPVRKKTIRALMQGNYRRVAALYAGLTPEYLDKCLKVGEEDLEAGRDTKFARFFLQVLEAEASAEQCIVDAVYKAGLLDPRLGLEFLSRKCPEEWGKKDRLTLEGGKEPVRITTVRVRESPEARNVQEG